MFWLSSLLLFMKTIEPSILSDCLKSVTNVENDVIQGTFTFPPDFIAFAGHFPGQPILPAVVQLAAVRLLASFKAPSTCAEKPRKCPICDKKMRKIIVGQSQPTLLIDKCAKGDGLWFDKGELHEIFDRAELDENNQIQDLLADMFGYDKKD